MVDGVCRKYGRNIGRNGGSCEYLCLGEYKKDINTKNIYAHKATLEDTNHLHLEKYL